MVLNTFKYYGLFCLSKIELGVVRRGTILSEPKKITVTDTIVASIKISKHTNWKIKNNQRVRTHLGTREVLARLKFLHRNKENNYNCLILYIKVLHYILVTIYLLLIRTIKQIFSSRNI